MSAGNFPINDEELVIPNSKEEQEILADHLRRHPRDSPIQTAAELRFYLEHNLPFRPTLFTALMEQYIQEGENNVPHTFPIDSVSMNSLFVNTEVSRIRRQGQEIGPSSLPEFPPPRQTRPKRVDLPKPITTKPSLSLAHPQNLSNLPFYSTLKPVQGPKGPSVPSGIRKSRNKGFFLSDDVILKRRNLKEEDLFTPRTFKGNPESLLWKDTEGKINLSSDMKAKAGLLELGSNDEEKRVGEQDMKMGKFDSLKKDEKLEENEHCSHERGDAETKGEERKYVIDIFGEGIGSVADFKKTVMLSRTRDGHTEIFNKYPFRETNPMRETKDPFDEGLTLLCAGDFPSAALCFEAACSGIQPGEYREKSEYWLYLGISQAANEHDVPAIIAFKEYLLYEPDNLHCLMFLTVSYLNEDYENFAMITLWQWLNSNPKYSDLVNILPPADMHVLSSPVNLDFHQKLLKLYLKAANKVPKEEVDADVQCALGFLYIMIKEYCKAIDCFKAALLVNPLDEILWNHLGEALMNNHKFADCIDAYTNALNFGPQFARTQYHLGLCYSMMQNDKEAIKHYIQALSILAESSRGLVGTMCSCIMIQANLTAKNLKRLDLAEAVVNRDIAFLNKAFPFVGFFEKDEPIKKNTIFRLMRYLVKN